MAAAYTLLGRVSIAEDVHVLHLSRHRRRRFLFECASLIGRVTPVSEGFTCQLVVLMWCME